MTEERFNGWADFETWIVALWLENDRGLVAYWSEQARECWEVARQSDRVQSRLFTRCDEAAIYLADRLNQALATERQPRLPDLYADLLEAALAEVNWFEIAERWLQDAIAEMVETKTSDEGEKQHE